MQTYTKLFLMIEVLLKVIYFVFLVFQTHCFKFSGFLFFETRFLCVFLVVLDLRDFSASASLVLGLAFYAPAPPHPTPTAQHVVLNVFTFLFGNTFLHTMF